MKRYIFLFLVVLSFLTGQAQGGYNPENPGDPNPYRKLTLLASPKVGGEASSYSGSQVVVGQEVNCYASANTYYEFVHWTKDGEVVSTNRNYSFVMPDEDIELIAVFELNYNPENPGDPQEVKPTHRVTLTALPGKGGRFNSSVFKLEEGDSTNVYAYPNEGYKFQEWQMNGVVVSRKNPMMVKMGSKNLAYTATFVYDPTSPSDPDVNMFNPGTGEMLIDRFTPGELGYAISSLLEGYYDYSLIQTLVVSGVMESYDFGFTYYLNNCSKIDLSRTNGYNEIPSYAFESMSSLTELLLPSCIGTIGDYAFSGCSNLSVLTCYAVIPPKLSNRALSGLDKSVVIQVPAQSLDLYKNANGWMDYTILPADANLYSLTVALPTDAADGRYKNMGIELLNTTNGQRIKYLITAQEQYTFYNLLPSTSYNVSVKNSKNEVLGELTGIDIIDNDVKLTFESLRQPKTVSIRVLTPDSQDVTSDVNVKWYDKGGNLLQQGSSVSGVLQGSELSYTISLPQSLATEFLVPSKQNFSVNEHNNDISLTLEAIGKTILSGTIYNEDVNPVASAVLAISQYINDAFVSSITTTTNSDGYYEIEVPNVPLTIIVSANGYVNQTKELANASDGLGNLALAKITGLTIIPSYTFQGSVVDGETAEPTEWYSDNSNIAYRVEDLVGNELDSCIYQATSIVLPSFVSVGDELNVVAYSKTGKFKDVSQTVSLEGKTTYVTFPIVEYGAINVKCDEANESICIIYDTKGTQIGKANLNGNVATFTALPDGNYTIVSMKKSSLFNSVLNLSALESTNLTRGVDYLQNTINVTSGMISEITLPGIPELDESKLYYTASDGTYFMPNKAHITIGNYLTLKSKVTLKDKYADKIDAATLVVDIPTSCEFVENSVISGSGYLGYSVEGNRISIPMANFGDVIRFCIIPLEGGECRPNAFVKLIEGNEEVLQPIGSAYFEAQNFNLFAPQKTSTATITVHGAATGGSEVSIFDNGTLVAKTYSMPNGEWSTKISFVKPYSHSFHEIYAEIMTNDGKVLPFETVTVDYNEAYPELKQVSMLYNQRQIEFYSNSGNFIKNSYSYVPGNDSFVFLAEFTDNSTDIISDLVFKVLASDGSVRTLEGIFNSTSNKWVAYSNYSDTNVLPVNVKVEYDCESFVDFNYEEMALDEEFDILNELYKFNQAFDESNVYVSSISEDCVELESDVESLGYKVKMVIEFIDFKTFSELFKENEKFIISNGDFEFYTLDTLSDNNYESYYWQQNDNEVIKLTLHFPQGPAKVAAFGSFSTPAFSSMSQLGYSWNQLLDGKLYSELMRKTNAWVGTTTNKSVRVNDLLNAKCTNGENSVKDDDKKVIKRKVADINSDIDLSSIAIMGMTNNYNLNIFKQSGRNLQMLYLTQNTLPSLSSSQKFGKVGSFLQLISEMWKEDINIRVSKKNSQNTSQKVLLKNTTSFLQQCADLSNIRDDIKVKFKVNHKRVSDNIKDVKEEIAAASNPCKKQTNDKNITDKFFTPSATPTIDPSGYVYEAVPSNRVQGVTATAFYKQQTEDMYGDITETTVVWDAAPFGQENPLITDEQGIYAWDVPQGMWQVKFEKEGYEATQSEWLPVPPPQLDVNVAITQTKQPEVIGVHAYADGVTIEFDKFMLPSTLTFGNITVGQNGKLTEGTVTAMNMEIDAKGNAYCSKVEFKPIEDFADGEATLFVSKAVKSYANISMSEDFTQTFAIEPRIREIICEDIYIPCGRTKTVEANILPIAASQGKMVVVESLNDVIATVSTDKVVVDENGIVRFDVTGLIVGTGSVKISVEGYDCTVFAPVEVTASDSQVAEPKASIPSGEVEKGTEVYLSCETEGATIYYTTDGSCPCYIATAMVYDGNPIVINESMTIKAIAMKEDMDDSDIVEFTYTVIVEDGVESIIMDEDLTIYPIPVRDKLNISVCGKMINNVTVVTMNGLSAMGVTKAAREIQLDVRSLAPGMYIVIVSTADKTYSRKVLKIE